MCLFDPSITKPELSVFSAAKITPSLQFTPTHVLRNDSLFHSLTKPQPQLLTHIPPERFVLRGRRLLHPYHTKRNHSRPPTFLLPIHSFPLIRFAIQQEYGLIRSGQRAVKTRSVSVLPSQRMTGSKRLLLLAEDPSSLHLGNGREEGKSVEAYCSVLKILCDCFLKCYRGAEGVSKVIFLIRSG